MTTTEEETATDSISRVTAENGIEYAYRDFGAGNVPLVLLQHFRGSLDNWDPALIDALASERRVVAFDNVGVAGTTGRTPSMVEAMAHDAIAFVDAIGLERIDLLGFSIGSFVAQEIALIRPDLLRRLVLASAAPQGASGMHGWAPDVIGAVGGREPNPQGYLDVFFAHTDSSRQAGQEVAGRIFGRTADRDEPTSWETRQAQYDAICAWGIPNHALLERVTGIQLPVLVANGDSDPMILPRYSHLLAGLLPDARLKIYPDAAHGFLFQHHAEFAADVHAFLEEGD
jgi:pimeloyl-ACP methyl ester carboxylesterase